MKEVEDRAPLGNQKNNIIRANIPVNTTLAQLIALLNTGLYADILANNATDANAGVAKVGTPFNKELMDSINEGDPGMFAMSDLAIQKGTFTNAGAGWQTYTFAKPFEGVPKVFVSSAFEGFIRIQNVTATSFQYCLETVTPTTGSYYTASGTASTSTHSANTLVNGINLNTTATAHSVDFLAIYDGE